HLPSHRRRCRILLWKCWLENPPLLLYLTNHWLLHSLKPNQSPLLCRFVLRRRPHLVLPSLIRFVSFGTSPLFVVLFLPFALIHLLNLVLNRHLSCPSFFPALR